MLAAVGQQAAWCEARVSSSPRLGARQVPGVEVAGARMRLRARITGDRGRPRSGTLSCRPRSRTRAATSALGLNGSLMRAPVESESATHSSSPTKASRSGAGGRPASSTSARIAT
jgi:hypothetical protein